VRIFARTGALTPCGVIEADEHLSSFRSEGHEDQPRLGAFVGDLPDGLLYRLPTTRGTDAAE
jgi:hypothetical protein